MKSQVKIVDPKTSEIVPVNTPGEICTRGYNTMLGYWNQPDKTSEIISEDGWIRSGYNHDLNLIRSALTLHHL